MMFQKEKCEYINTSYLTAICKPAHHLCLCSSDSPQSQNKKGCMNFATTTFNPVKMPQAYSAQHRIIEGLSCSLCGMWFSSDVFRKTFADPWSCVNGQNLVFTCVSVFTDEQFANLQFPFGCNFPSGLIKSYICLSCLI